MAAANAAAARLAAQAVGAPPAFVFHARADHDENRIVLLRASPRPEASLPLAQLETQSSARLPANTNHQPPPVYSARSGRLGASHRTASRRSESQRLSPFLSAG